MSPTTMRGIGGIGPKITHEVVVRVRFVIKSGYSAYFEVSCGVIADNTFPGQLILGKTIFHKFGVHCQSNGKGKKETIHLTNFPEQPVLEPVEFSHKQHNQTHLTSFLVADQPQRLHKKYKWGNRTPQTNTHIDKLVDSYVQNFPSLFDPELRQTNKIMNTKHRIDTADAKPIKHTPRRYSPIQEQAISLFVQKNLGKIIQHSKGPWASRVVLIPKKTPGQTTKPSLIDPDKVTYRICCDYRDLNRITKKHAHPLPNTMDQIQRTAGHRYYTFIDLKDGFWHVSLAESDREKTAFITPFGLFEWLVMPF
ncbi:hypothetical protein K3495_g15290, partial [Podosphaera aphanis]